MDQNTGSSVQRGSRGRGRGVRPSTQGPPGFPNLRQQQPQLLGAWARRGAVQSPPTSTVAPPVAGVINAFPVPAVVNTPPVPQSGSGDLQGAPSHGGATPRASASAVRGRRGRTTEPAFRTRPEEVISKQGTSGRPIALKTNHLRLRHSKQVSLQQYRVDFVPELDNTKLKKGLFRTAFREVVPDCLFDGTVLYSTVHFPEPVERLAESTRGERFQITMRLVGSLAWGDYQYIPVLNIIVRKCLRLMNFELVRRDYFDPQRQIQFRHGDMNFNVWPGFFTSMRQCEDDLLLNTEVLFKVMRRENAFDLFMLCAAQRNARQAYRSQVIGTVVMTPHNNKTYRIDDVDFDSTPQTTFPKADGTRVSLQDYYRTRYGINISSPNQPLLVSRASRREIRGGMSELIWLVPELCVLTGLTDQQRENFQMMRELGRITRLSAPDRVRQLTEFARRINADPNATRELRTWDVGIADSLLELQGRLLPTETVHSARANAPIALLTKFFSACAAPI